MFGYFIHPENLVKIHLMSLNSLLGKAIWQNSLKPYIRRSGHIDSQTEKKWCLKESSQLNSKPTSKRNQKTERGRGYGWINFQASECNEPGGLLLWLYFGGWIKRDWSPKRDWHPSTLNEAKGESDWSPTRLKPNEIYIPQPWMRQRADSDLQTCVQKDSLTERNTVSFRGASSSKIEVMDPTIKQRIKLWKLSCQNWIRLPYGKSIIHRGRDILNNMPIESQEVARRKARVYHR